MFDPEGATVTPDNNDEYENNNSTTKNETFPEHEARHPKFPLSREEVYGIQKRISSAESIADLIAFIEEHGDLITPYNNVTIHKKEDIIDALSSLYSPEDPGLAHVPFAYGLRERAKELLSSQE